MLAAGRLIRTYGLLFGATGTIIGCNSVTPRQVTPPPTILVENNTCEAGRCMVLEVRAFVWSFTIPQSPWGGRVLGYALPGQSCIVLPNEMTATVVGINADHTVDTTYYHWKPSTPSGMFLVAVDSAAWHSGAATDAQADSINAGIFPYDGLGPSVGETATFVPGNSPGWDVVFPSTPAHGSEITATSERCSS